MSDKNFKIVLLSQSSAWVIEVSLHLPCCRLPKFSDGIPRNGASLTPVDEFPTMQDAFLKSSEKYENRIDGITLNLFGGKRLIALKICFEPGSLFGSKTTKCLPLSVRLLKSSFACLVVFACSEVTG